MATRRRGGLYELTAVPVAIFVVALLFVVSAPLQNASSQRLEAEAYWIALEATRDPDATDTLFEEFVRLELIDPSPQRGLGPRSRPPEHDAATRDGRGVEGSRRLTRGSPGRQFGPPRRCSTPAIAPRTSPASS